MLNVEYEEHILSDVLKWRVFEVTLNLLGRNLQVKYF